MNQFSYQKEMSAISGTNLFDSLIQDYIDRPNKLSDCLQYEGSIEGIIKAAQDKKYEDRRGLVEEINRQYQGLILHHVVSNNIHLLEKENTYCIVTAHQLSLLGGPLYYAHKILSIIKLCERLNQTEKGFAFVPVFVLGSEDHDFEEVNHVVINHNNYQWKTQQGGAVGRFQWDHAGQAMIQELCDGLLDRDLANKILSIYKIGESYSSIQRKLLNVLFEQFGLIIVDLDTAYFKKKCAPIFLDEIDHGRAGKVLKDHIEKLSSCYHVQAYPREINIFELKKDARVYVEKINTPIQAENLSPNVIYRPLMQQFCLPAVCYTGGGGELAYWLELKPLFEYYKVAYPVLCLRNHILYAEEKTFHKLHQWGFKSEFIFKPSDQILRDWIAQHESFTAVFKNAKNELNLMFKPIQNEANLLEPTLLGAVLAEHHRSLEILDKLEKKFIKASKRKNEDLTIFVEKWKEQFFPKGVLMERYQSTIEWYDRYGKVWFEAILKEIEPFSKEILFLYT